VTYVIAICFKEIFWIIFLKMAR